MALSYPQEGFILVSKAIYLFLHGLSSPACLKHFILTDIQLLYNTARQR